VTVGDSLSGIAGLVISVAPGLINFVLPAGIAADDDVAFIINNNGVISEGKVNVRDAAPGIYTVRSDGKGSADAKCVATSDDGKETLYTQMPCLVGYDNANNSLALYGTGWRFGSDLRVRFRFKIENNEEDEVELTPGYAGRYVDDDGKEHLGLDQIIVTLDEELTGKLDVETTVLLTSNSESVISQEQITTSFAGFQEDLIVINAASQESGAVARGSIASARPQNDDDEEDVFTDQTIKASATNPPLELAGIRVKVAGLDARILSVAPDEVRFIVPAGVEASENALARLTNGVKVFNVRIPVNDAAPGLFTQTDDGDGAVTARCGLVLGNGAIEYSAPPCAVSEENEKRILVLTGTGWRFASGVKVTFDGTEIIPTYAGPEPGLPGVDRIEAELTGDVATNVAGKEKDIIINASINGESVSSQTGATVAFKEKLDEANARSRIPARVDKIPGATGSRKRQRNVSIKNLPNAPPGWMPGLSLAPQYPTCQDQKKGLRCCPTRKPCFHRRNREEREATAHDFQNSGSPPETALVLTPAGATCVARLTASGGRDSSLCSRSSRRSWRSRRWNSRLT